MRAIFILFFTFAVTSIFSQDFTISIASQENPTCTAADDGAITVEVMNGVAPITYTLDNFIEQDNGIFENLEAGDYTIIATDATGAFVQVSTTLVDPLPIALQIDGIDPTCQDAIDGMIIVSEVNNLPDVEYSISGPVMATNSTGIFNDLGVGTYIVSAATSPDCRVVISTILASDVECPQELSLSIENQTNPACDDVTNGSIIVVGSGGVLPYSYSIEGGSEQDNGTFEGLGDGEYELSVTDAEGVTVLLSIILENEINLSIGINQTDPSCEDATDGQLELVEENGVSNITFSISGPTSATNSTGIFTNLSTGTYTLSASFNSQCTVESSAVLSSDIECEDEDLCPVTFNKVGMQINKTEADNFQLRVTYNTELDIIDNLNYTQLYEIIEFHILNRRVKLTEAVNFKFENYCGIIESYRNENVDIDLESQSLNVDYIDLNEVDVIRTLLSNINVGECIKI